MAELDPIVARVLLKGDDEFLSSIEKVGEKGAESIKKIAEAAAEKGPLATLASSLLAIEVAISGVVAATILFIEQQTELSQKTILLAEAFGTTAGKLQDLEAIFASSGVKVEQFERFANRLTITIAREWPAISESIKTYADQNDAAQLRVTNATLRVHDAQNQLMDGSAERASRAAHDNQAIEASEIKLQFAAREAANAQVDAMHSVQGAVLGATAARQRLAALQGAPPSASEKEALQLAQAEQAVQEADQKVVEAKLKAQEQAAEASLKQRQLSQANSDLERKAAKDARDDAEQAVKDHNAVRSALIQESEAQEKLGKLALTSVSSIRTALEGITTGNKDAAKSIDLTQVSVQHLTDGLIAQAAAANKGVEPSGFQVLSQISKTLNADVGGLITKQERLAIVNRLAGTSMQALGASAAEILDVLENDTKDIDKLSEAAQSFGEKVPPPSIKEFRGALASLNLVISQLSQALAAAVAPAFTVFLNSIKSSLTESNGVLHNFGEGLLSIGQAISYVVGKWNDMTEAVANFVGFDRVKLFKLEIVALGVAFAAMLGPIALIPVAIGLIVVAIGAVRDHWDEITVAVKRAWAAVTDNGVAQFIGKIVEGMGNIVKYAAALAGFGSSKAASSDSSQSSTQKFSGVQDGFDESGQPIARAGGGMIDGPGSHTSDSIVARLSRGEFVMRAAAVQQFGSGFMHALNAGIFPGFAAGGMVPSPVRMGAGGAMPATSTLNLSIDGRSFGGLRGPKSTVDDLTSFAISRQTSQAGNKPSWYK